jgi:lipopolysaccharide transport system permease protein
LDEPYAALASMQKGDAVALPRTVIEPARGWQGLHWAELWRFRELLYFFCWRDVRIRYKQTFLGAAWAVLQPGLLLLVFSLFFGRLGSSSDMTMPYPLFVCAGILPWTFFATALANAANSVVSSERLVTKVYFPRLLLPLSSVGAALVDFVIAIGLLMAVMAWYGVGPSPWMVLVPFVMAVLALAALGVGTLLAALNVYYRDFRYIVPFMIQVGLFATPTIYLATDKMGPHVKAWLWLNPVTGPIAMFRACIIGGELPWGPFFAAAGWSAILTIVGALYFRRVEDTFADRI